MEFLQNNNHQAVNKMTYRPKCWGNNNKYEDNSPKTLNDKNHQGSSQKFRQITPEEGRRTYRPKCCGNNNKYEDNSPKTLNDKNHQALSQKFRQQIPEEGRRTYWPKRCRNDNRYEDNSPKTLNDKNHRASSLKFRQLILFTFARYQFQYISWSRRVYSYDRSILLIWHKAIWMGLSNLTREGLLV